ncbi:MAG TPA: hypothetical protein VJY34_02400 [Roseiarcus sp.]|nr:hypothetical protein [Roseiarcus sp.]
MGSEVEAIVFVASFGWGLLGFAERLDMAGLQEGWAFDAGDRAFALPIFSHLFGEIVLTDPSKSNRFSLSIARFERVLGFVVGPFRQLSGSRKNFGEYRVNELRYVVLPPIERKLPAVHKISIERPRRQQEPIRMEKVFELVE